MKHGSWNAVVMLALLLVIGIAGVVAQTPNSEMSGIVGTWREQVTARNCETGEELASFSVLSTFAQGGTVSAIGSTPPTMRSPGYGFWHHTEGNTYSHMHEAFLFDADGAWSGTQRVTVVHEISGDDRTSDAKTEFFDTEGNLVMSGCATAVSRRMK